MKKSTKIFSILLIMMMISSMVYAEPIKVLVNGSQLALPTNPVSKDGRTLVPLRAIFESLGAIVEWDQDTKTVMGTQGIKTIKLQIDNNVALVNGAEVKLDVPGQIINGSTFVPVRFIAESLGAKVDWDGNNNAVIINTDAATTTTVPTPAPLPMGSSVQPLPSQGQSNNVGNVKTSGVYIGSTESDKYHKPTCRWAKEIFPSNAIWFDTVDEAKAYGYVPCGVCSPK